LFLRGWGIVAAVFLVVAGVLWGSAQSTGRSADLLERYGVETIAVVVDRATERRTDSEGRTTTAHVLTLRFTPANSAPVEIRRTVPRNVYDQATLGTEQPLRYVEHDPTIVEFEAGETRGTSRVLWIVSVVAALVGTYAAQRRGRMLLSVRRAVVSGEAREARVTANDVTNTRINREVQHRIAWIDARGNTGRSGLIGAGRAAAFPVGSVVVVWADPRTGRTWWQDELVSSQPRSSWRRRT
jgi:hypothetical protein